jgi:hypothetical protein
VRKAISRAVIFLTLLSSASCQTISKNDFMIGASTVSMAENGFFAIIVGISTVMEMSKFEDYSDMEYCQTIIYFIY